MSWTGPPRGPRAGRGARRRRGPAPRARGRGSRRAPGGRPGPRSGAELPLGSRRLEGDRQTAAPPGHRVASITASPPSSAPEGDRDVVGLGDQLDLRGERPALAREPDRRQRPLADDHRVDELDRDVADVGARRGGEADRDQPAAAREALGHQMAELRDPLRLGLEEARFASLRSATRASDALPPPARPPARERSQNRGSRSAGVTALWLSLALTGRLSRAPRPAATSPRRRRCPRRSGR